MISYIRVEHYKSLDYIELDLSPVTVLVGANGTGKSNFVDAIRFMKDAVQFDLDRAVSERHGIDSIRQWSPRRPYNFKIELGLRRSNDRHGKYAVTLASQGGKFRIVREEAQWNEVTKRYSISNRNDPAGRRPAAVSTRFVRNRDGTVEWAETQDGHTEQRTAKVELKDELLLSGSAGSPWVHFPGSRFLGMRGLSMALHDIETYSIFPNVLRTPQTRSVEARLHSTGDNLTSIFKAMSRSKRGSAARAEITDSLKKIMPNLEAIIIQSVGGLMVPAFRVKESDGTRHDFNVSQISDGTLRVLGLLTALYQPNRPSVIALEEPEQTVNPAVLAVVAEAIKDVGKKSQVLVTTHSPHFIDQFEPEEIRAVEMIDNVTRVSTIADAQRNAVRERLFTLGELMTVEGLYGN